MKDSRVIDGMRSVDDDDDDVVVVRSGGTQVYLALSLSNGWHPVGEYTVGVVHFLQAESVQVFW